MELQVSWLKSSQTEDTVQKARSASMDTVTVGWPPASREAQAQEWTETSRRSNDCVCAPVCVSSASVMETELHTWAPKGLRFCLVTMGVFGSKWRCQVKQTHTIRQADAWAETNATNEELCIKGQERAIVNFEFSRLVITVVTLWGFF